MLEKAAASKTCEYLQLATELKSQASAAEEQYQKLDKILESNIQEEKNS